ncbi:hypothetical protein F66182_4567 [Fusarium sp. NRRL 66182]|nr:hypothetical protein F66182_4567 [Fusarium sp. NRRL 66182]
MSKQEEIKRLRLEIEQVNARIQQSEERIQQSEERIQQSEERIQQAEEQERRKTQATTLDEYLYHCHFDLYEKLKLAPKHELSTGHTKVDGKYYPKWLRPWDGFMDIQRRQHFEEMRTSCGERRLFHPQIVTEDWGQSISHKPARNENSVFDFEKSAVEHATCNIVSAFWNEEGLGEKYGVTGLRFTRNFCGFPHSNSGSHPGQPPLARPDGGGIRTRLDGNENLAFVFDYKAVHKIAAGQVKATVAKEMLFMEVIQRMNSNKLANEKQLREHQYAETLIAMALTQVFDYMIRYGVAYGYIAAGKCLLLLYIDRSDLQTLYCHPCVPSEDVGEVSAGTWKERASYTAVAQLASFCLLSLRSEALWGTRLDSVSQMAEATLRKWKEPYKGAARLLDASETDSNPASSSSSSSSGSTDDPDFKYNAPPTDRDFQLRSRFSCQGGAPSSQRRKDGNDDNGEGDSGPNSDQVAPSVGTETGMPKGELAESVPTKQYCTQACLLGLRRRRNLDKSCPNILWHQSAGDGIHHPIDTDELTSLVGKQLCQNPYENCQALNIWSKAGSTAMPFKVELARYGYTLVGKGTVLGHLETLEHESRIYAYLDRLQGAVVPVHLGLIRLDRGYILPGGARVVCMMLMAWGGETVDETVYHQGAGLGQVDLETEARRASKAVWAEGVDHGDEHDSNRLWNAECGRVMLIDFGRAMLRPPPKHKQLLALSEKKKRKERKEKKEKRRRPSQAL